MMSERGIFIVAGGCAFTCPRIYLTPFTLIVSIHKLNSFTPQFLSVKAPNILRLLQVVFLPPHVMSSCHLLESQEVARNTRNNCKYKYIQISIDSFSILTSNFIPCAVATFEDFSDLKESAIVLVRCVFLDSAYQDAVQRSSYGSYLSHFINAITRSCV